MLLLDTCNAFRGSHEAHQADIRAAALLQHRKGVAGTATGGEHRVGYNDKALADILRKLAVINNRIVGSLVTVEADMAHLGYRHEGLKTFNHTESGTQDRHDGHLPSGYLPGCHLADRGFDFHIVKRQIPGDFITHEKGNFPEKNSEVLGSGLLFPHDGQLVLDHRMIDKMQLAHSIKSVSMSFVPQCCNKVP